MDSDRLGKCHTLNVLLNVPQMRTKISVIHPDNDGWQDSHQITLTNNKRNR